MKRATKRILIVDSDVGFVYWLGAVLIAAEHQPWPAVSASNAISVVDLVPLVRLDFLIVNASLPGVSELIAQLRRTQANLRVLALGARHKSLRGVNAWRPKTGPRDDTEGREWVRVIKILAARCNCVAWPQTALLRGQRNLGPASGNLM